MYRGNSEERSIFFKFHSHREQVIETIDNSDTFLTHFITDPEAIGVKVILRELLMNAVIHGNKSNKALVVKCAIESLGEKRFKICVEDEGNGFDHGTVADNDQDFQSHKKGRGYLLINRLSDRVQFNEAGNRVTVYLKCNA